MSHFLFYYQHSINIGIINLKHAGCLSTHVTSVFAVNHFLISIFQGNNHHIKCRIINNFSCLLLSHLLLGIVSIKINTFPVKKNFSKKSSAVIALPFLILHSHALKLSKFLLDVEICLLFLK